MCLPTRILQLLCIASLNGGATGCNIDDLENCQFAVVAGEPTLCGWTLGGNFVLTYRTLGGYIHLVQGSDTGSLTSRAACSTGGQTHCFRFAYGIDGDNILNLSVSIKYGLNESLLWILSSGGGWNEASVPITTNHDFNVIFKAERHCGQNANQGSVRIDAIRYEKLPTNSCSFEPSTASPTSVPTPRSCNSTIPLLSTTQNTTISHETGTETTVTPHIYTSSSNGGHQQILTTTNQTTTTPNETLTDTTVTDDYFNTKTPDDGVQQTRSSRPGTQFPTSADSKNDVSEPLNNAGVIAGCVLAGVAIIVTVTLVVLFRQKRLHFGKPCFENKQRPQDDDGYEIPLPRTDLDHNTETASRTENEGAREVVSRTDIENRRDHALTQLSDHRQVSTHAVANNYDSLDFSNSERDTRVYTSLNDVPEHLTVSSQPGLYDALGERRDSHIYDQTPGASPAQDSCVYYNVVES